MPETFHQFLELPWELRNQIWNLATRHQRPAAHVFGIYNNIEDKDVDRNMDVAFHKEFDCCPHGPQLSAPKRLPRSVDENLDFEWRKESPASWTSNNNSAYLVDGGLWTACRESRMVMESRFSEKNRLAKMAPATCYFVGQDSINHYFTTLPHQDLFILQPFNLKTMPFGDIDQRVPLGSTSFGFDGIANIAIEFDPAWGQEIYQCYDNRGSAIYAPIVQDFACAVRDVGYRHTIWLIDYGIKRTQHVPNKNDPLKDNAPTFYMEDRKFIACDNLGVEWDNEDAYNGFYESGHSFVGRVDGEMYDIEAEPDAYYPGIRILACEYL